MTTSCRVSVIIKALNEEAGIAVAVRSALRAVAEAGGGEVILADSGSTDRTVAIASEFPIRIVQLLDPKERSCGVGPQLGWQVAHGEYVYVMDGDMELLPGFLRLGLSFLKRHPEIAGVGGRLVELNHASIEYRERTARAASPRHSRCGPVNHLDGGGLYRRTAIQDVGHLSDRNLHSYEEFDLGARLQARGWKLWRLPGVAVSHMGHVDPAPALLLRRWRSGYAWGCGELLRAALGQPWLSVILGDLRELRLYLLVWVWWLLLCVLAFLPQLGPWRAPAFAMLVLVPWGALCALKRSFSTGSYALLSWCVNAAGLARGLLARRTSASLPIASRVLREPHERQGSHDNPSVVGPPAPFPSTHPKQFLIEPHSNLPTQ